MNKYIVLLKGINVGGHKKVLMAELRELLSNTNFQNVQTYIQSGNLILESPEKDVKKLKLHMQNAIKNHFGFEISVLIKTPKEFQQIFNACPFPKDIKQLSYFVILDDAPNKDLLNDASVKIYDGELYEIINDCIYFYFEKGFGQSKFNINFFERKLKTIGTARNFKTMVKLLSLST